MSGAATLDWPRLKALFAEAVELQRDQRDAWLRERCADAPELLAELRGLLEEHDAAPCSMLAADARPLVAELTFGGDNAETALQGGAAVGPYRVLRTLGEGGMGRVYLAERADGQFRQRVALKVIRGEYATAQLRERFLRERDILARLNHPNIAQLHDGGVTETGAPFFTLEYIDGESITRWCDAHHGTVRERVELLLKVCDAVQYAHRNLVVHRDLKPSNILVTAGGEPKLLDFGIAKPLDDAVGQELTATHARPMTREYAAPEQVLGESITTATDVYALGVLLYELLSGHLPYARAERGETSWPKAVVEEQPESMSHALRRPTTDADRPDGVAGNRGLSSPALQRLLRGDLDRIARRALEKAPEARYPSVTAFAADLRAWSEGRALPGGNRRYRLTKFVRRNRAAVGVAASFLLLVIASLSIIAIEARRAATEAQAALRQARTTAAVKDFLLELFRKADPNVAKGREMSAREVVDRGAERVAKMPADQTDLKAELQNALGTIYFQLGLNKQASALHQQALDELLATHGDSQQIARAERDLATELVPLGQMDKARTLAKDAVARVQAAPDAPVDDVVQSLYTLGWVEESSGNGAAEMAVATQALAAARQPGVDERVLAQALNLVASSYWNLHDPEQAARNYAEALKIDERLLGADDQLTLRDVNGVAAALFAGGRYAEAVQYFSRSRDGYQRLYGGSDVRTLHSQEGLALVEREAGLYAESKRDFEQILAALKEHPPQNNRFEVEVTGNYSMLLAELGDLDGAQSRAESVHEAFDKLLGATAGETIEAIGNLGYVHALKGQLESAQQELQQAIDGKRKAHDDDVALELGWLADVQRLRGDSAAAVALAQQARDVAVKLYGERSGQAARAHYALGLALLAAQRNEAETELRASLASFALIAPPDGMHPYSAGPRLVLGKLLAARGESRRADARALLRQALELRTATYGDGHPFTIEARTALATLSR